MIPDARGFWKEASGRQDLWLRSRRPRGRYSFRTLPLRSRCVAEATTPYIKRKSGVSSHTHTRRHWLSGGTEARIWVVLCRPTEDAGCTVRARQWVRKSSGQKKLKAAKKLCCRPAPPEAITKTLETEVDFTPLGKENKSPCASHSPVPANLVAGFTLPAPALESLAKEQPF